MNLSPAHVLHPLLETARREPDRVLLTFVNERGEDAEVRTASQLLERASRLGAHLRKSHALNPGDVALLVYPPSMAFVDAFVACLLVGIVPAPVYPPHPGHPDADLARLSATAAHSRAKAMLTSRNYRWMVRLSATRQLLRGSERRWPALPWVVTEGAGERPLEGGEGTISADTLAFLQFTSGSTSSPKGVRLTHGNLSHQLDFNAARLDMGPDARFVAWVPQYHDLGLISGLLGALRGNGALWFMSPQSFLANVALWPEVMHRVGATHSASPNFGFELLRRRTNPEQRARWDLSRMRVLMSAAEPIAPRTVDAFFEAFAPSRLSASCFSPAYGLAEHTVGVTLGGKTRVRVDRASLSRTGTAFVEEHADLELVGCGTPSHGIEVRVVAESGQALPDRRVGEIWVQSPSVADGYQGNVEATAASFGATLAGHAGGWLRTGDLGFFHRGELFVTGRKKDLIIFRGRNLHPEDLEEVLRSCHPGVRPGGLAAFAVPGEGTEALVVVAEVKDPAAAPLNEIAATLERLVLETWQIVATVGLVAPGSVSRTSSGKVQRSACRQAWLDGQLVLLHRGQKPSTVRALEASAPLGNLAPQLAALGVDDRLPWLIEVLRKLAFEIAAIDTSTIGLDEFLPNHGFDSLLSSQLLTEIEKRFECTLSATLLVEHPTLRGAASQLLTELGVPFSGGSVAERVESPLEPLPFRPPLRRMAPASTRVAVVGGGVSGLVAALELARLGYTRITLFESTAELGGKVFSPRTADQSIVELGQLYIPNTSSLTFELASLLGLEPRLNDHKLTYWTEEFGFEDAPASSALSRWLRTVMKAARAPAETATPFPSLLDLDEPFGKFLERHGIRTVHPRFAVLWTAMGYGRELDCPASYVISYLQLMAGMTGNWFLPAGNQVLWRALGEHVQRDWGVEVRCSAAVEKVEGDETGVRVTSAGHSERFDEVILAAPPEALRQMLPSSDPLIPLLSRFTSLGFRTQAVHVEGLPEKTCVFHPGQAHQLGKTGGLQAQLEHPNWYVGGQYTAHEPEAELEAELRSTALALGAKEVSSGPARTWSYFPHVREGTKDTLRSAESLQGLRHVWATGSWISFETVEHAARHARHLVQTAFDPSALP